MKKETTTQIRSVQREDVLRVAQLMAEFYKEEGYPFNDKATIENLYEFIEQPHLGAIFGAIHEHTLVGYIVITHGYSFEYGGRGAFIDELFVLSDFRGQQFGKKLLQHAFEYGQNQKLKTLHLEVELHKTKTRKLYEKFGFTSNNRTLMTLHLNFK